MTGGLLIVRRDGTLWGLPAAQISAIERQAPAAPETKSGSAPGNVAGVAGVAGGAGIALRFAGGGSMAVDSVLTLATDLAIHPLSARLRRLLPAGAEGLALLSGEPLVVLSEAGEPHV